MSDYLYSNPTKNEDRSTSRQGKHTFADDNIISVYSIRRSEIIFSRGETAFFISTEI